MATLDKTWWALPEVVKDRIAFAQVADAEAESMRAKNFTNADYIDAINKAKAWGAGMGVQS